MNEKYVVNWTLIKRQLLFAAQQYSEQWSQLQYVEKQRRASCGSVKFIGFIKSTEIALQKEAAAVQAAKELVLLNEKKRKEKLKKGAIIMTFFGHSRYLSLYPVVRGEPIYTESPDDGKPLSSIPHPEAIEPMAEEIDLSEDSIETAEIEMPKGLQKDDIGWYFDALLHNKKRLTREEFESYASIFQFPPFDMSVAEWLEASKSYQPTETKE